MDQEASFSFTDPTGRTHSRLGATSMETYRRCPRLWHWQSLYVPVGLPAPWPVIGSAIHAGLATFYRNALKASTDPAFVADDPQQAALSYLQAHFIEQSEVTVEAAEKMVTKGLAAALSQPLQGWPVAVEEFMDDCTPDLVMGTPAGLVVWDFKWKKRVEDQWVGKELTGTRHLDQLYHNAWRVRQRSGQIPVVGIGKYLIIDQPKLRVRPYEYEMSDQRLAHWAMAHQVWRDRAMKDHFEYLSHGTLPPVNYTSCGDYGGCPFQRVCLDKDGDMTGMEAFFTSLPSK
jgi:hypothetical protein